VRALLARELPLLRGNAHAQPASAELYARVWDATVRAGLDLVRARVNRTRMLDYAELRARPARTGAQVAAWFGAGRPETRHDGTDQRPCPVDTQHHLPAVLRVARRLDDSGQQYGDPSRDLPFHAQDRGCWPMASPSPAPEVAAFRGRQPPEKGHCRGILCHDAVGCDHPHPRS
jgi:hypothetical protein